MLIRIAAIAISACASSGLAASAQEANPQSDARAFSITANFQVQLPIDAAAPTSEMTKAIAQVDQALGELANHECDVPASAFKADCHVLQLNMGANVNERRNRQAFNNDFGGMQRMVSANLNATFELTPLADPTKAAPAQ